MTTVYGDLVRYRELFGNLFRRDVQAKYRGSLLGLAWTLANPAVHVAIIGTRNADHVDDAVAAAGLELTDDVLRRIDEITRDAVHVAGPRPEAM